VARDKWSKKYQTLNISRFSIIPKLPPDC
jgi:hypothetical protein